MRTLFFVLLLGVAVTAALLWNRRAYAPVEVVTPSTGAGSGKAAAPLPVDKVVLVLGVPPGNTSSGGREPGKKAAPAAPPPAEVVPPAPSKRPKPLPAPPPAVRKARLKKGETVYGLAKRLLGDGGRYKEILRLNGLDEEKARRLPAGTILRIPYR